MPRFKLPFVRKFHLAFAILMLATVAMAWFYTESVEWHEQDVERITLANEVLQGYHELSVLIFSELGALSDWGLLGDGSDLLERGRDALAIREVVSKLRQGIAQEASISGSGDEGEELERLTEIEKLVEEIIRTSERIGQALQDGRNADARKELELFRTSAYADYFNLLIVAATADQKAKAVITDRKATALSLSIAKWMPVTMLCLVLITLFFIFVLSRHLTRSVSALHQGALALKNDDLSYRIPELSEIEFRRLGEAFNTMATQLSAQHERLRNSNLQLEGMIDERTRKLQESNRRLADADANRRRLLANISHEFRTPLTVIRGEAEIALRSFDKTGADPKDAFRRIVDQAENATRLVDDLLFIARADAGEPHLKLSSVVIARMIDSICLEFSAKAEEKGIQIVRGRLDNRAVVQGDQGRLRQVFAVLMENALKYSNSGDRIEIQALQVNGNVEIVFRDEGIGLTEEESELAFERFYRAPKAVEQATGTGLGLPVAKAIVEAHNGTISLRGKPGEGATATVVLPVGRPFGGFA